MIQVLLGYIVHKEHCRAVSVVTFYYRFETFLTGGVPNSQFYIENIVYFYELWSELDSLDKSCRTDRNLIVILKNIFGISCQKRAFSDCWFTDHYYFEKSILNLSCSFFHSFTHLFMTQYYYLMTYYKFNILKI